MAHGQKPINKNRQRSVCNFNTYLVGMSNSLRRIGTPLLNRATPGDRQVWFRLVTRDVDRHGTIIEPAGVDTRAFLANPVFLWMHDSGGGDRPTPPPDVVIGRVVEIDQTVEHFDICCQFDNDDTREVTVLPDGSESVTIKPGLATTCYRKVKAGFLRAVSIGCNALAESRATIDGVEVPVYTAVELLECSLVIIGSNRGALKLDRAAAAAMVARLDSEEGEAVGEQPSTQPAQSQPSSASTPAPIPHVATVAVFDLDGLMLWGRRRDSGKWTTPGGHMVPGEGATAAALRELHEEAAIDAAAHNARLTYLGPVDLSDADRALIVHGFRCDLQSRKITVTSDEDPDKEVAEWRWVALEDGVLPAEIGSAMHAPRNALEDLGVFRAVAGTDAATTALLSDVVDAGEFDAALLEKTIDFDYQEDESNNLFGGEDDSSLAVRSNAQPLARTVVAHKSYPLVQTAWDAATATARWKKWASSDGSGDKDKIDWAKYAQCFLWFDADNRESFGAYKFPHHDIVGGKPVTVWAGVVAAAARIDQAKGIPAADLVKMKAHLTQHYKEFDKVAPWQRRAAEDVRSLITAASRSLSVEDLNKMPSPVKDGPAHVPADEDGTYLHAQITVYALIFPARKFTRAEAALWAQHHGYTAYRVSEVGEGVSGKGLVVTENSIMLEQLPATCYQPSPFGAGIKWQTIVYPGAGDIACVYGVLKSQKVQYRRSIAAGLLNAVASALSASQRAELRTAATAWSLPLLCQALKLPQHSFAGKAARSLMQQLRDLLAALRNPAYQADFTLLQALNRSCAYSHNRTHYLSEDTVNGSSGRATTSNPTPINRGTPMKRTPEARMCMRALIHHALEHADMHARAMEDGHISDEHRAMCHAAALRALDTAAELHSAYRCVWLGATPSQEIVDSADVGMEYAMPKLPEGELHNRFAEVVAQVGKLPRSLRSLVQSELGTVDTDTVEIKLTNLKGVAEQFQSLKAEHQRGLVAADKAATEALIEGALDKRLVTPAEARKFRGLDPATGAVAGEAWNKAKVERFLAEREQIGPVASIARPGQERTVESPQQANVAAPAAKPSLIRFGAQASREVSPVQLRSDAESMAARLGLKVEDILSRTEAAANLPDSESRINQILGGGK